MEGFILFIVATALTLSLSPLLMLLSLVLDMKGSGERMALTAYYIDVAANVLFGPAWNLLLITSMAKRRYGRKGETLSEVTGYGQIQGELRILGRLLAYLLHRIDPFHCRREAGQQVPVVVRKWWQTLLAYMEVLAILLVLGSLIAFPFYLIFHFLTINK
ncbi:hypothetical protein [Runella salmonicolor]|uniref:Uncharacterized protein n=1 Tax=Runella salmonicolor TaxID=2950278 RepID=A0ABT1FSV7_9BACT|nr:hypothetical protein [Runella salmonicolor]MCP1384787.1 hypothetical protein [Runella salmonicolor]